MSVSYTPEKTSFDVETSKDGACKTYADPGVLDGLVGSDPLGRVNCQHLIDQILGLGGHCVPLWRRKLKEDPA